jgi:CBS-domain-containing membrane protein
LWTAVSSITAKEKDRQNQDLQQIVRFKSFGYVRRQHNEVAGDVRSHDVIQPHERGSIDPARDKRQEDNERARHQNCR